jgi:hypothetical protein
MTSRSSVVRIVGGVLVVLILAAAVLDPTIGWFAGLGLVGGALMAGVMLWVNRHARQRIATPDAFARDPLSTDVINVTRIRVAGLGGLGMVIVAAAVATQFDLAAVAVGFGLVGGAIGAFLLILYRRRGGPVDSSSQGPGARVMLSSREPRGARAVDEHRADGKPRNPGNANSGVIPAPAPRSWWPAAKPTSSAR